MGLPLLEPMLATRWPKVTDATGWVHEVKWDGVRAIASGDGTIRSRNGNRIETSYPELSDRVAPNLILDGEIVAFDADGRPSFQALQSRMHVRQPRPAQVAETPVTFMVFDVLFDGELLVDQAWDDRRRRLEELGFAAPLVLVDTHDDGRALFDAVVTHDLEGIVSKRRTSPYRPGRRSEDWRKTANRKTCEAVVIGSLQGTGARSQTFGSLALALWSGDRLRYIGSVGSGFDAATLRAVDAALEEMATSSPLPLEDATVVPAPVRWVVPNLVAVVEYASWTTEGRLRAPVFKGFSATAADEVTWVREGPG